MTSNCDVCVIGGGPSGSTAAALLSSKGYEVTLLERAKHPRYAVGESLIPHFWRYVLQSGAHDAIANEGFIQKSGGTVSWGDTIRQMTFRDFGYTQPALHVERDCFDELLLKNAKAKGAMVLEECLVTSINVDKPDSPSVKYTSLSDGEQHELQCRFVIDATGQKTLLSRQLDFWKLDEDFRFCSVWGYFKNSKYVASDGIAYSFENVVDIPPTTFVTSLGEWGWSWHIPQRKSTSVGFVLPTSDFRKIRTDSGSMEQAFLRYCETTPILNRLLEHAVFCPGSARVIRDYSYQSSQLSVPGCFMIGDAAAFIDPIFSIGIVLGMYSATLSAWAIDRSLRDSNTADHSREIFDTQFGERLAMARALALPGYVENRQHHADVVRQQMKFQRGCEIDLISVVSTLTNRSTNFTSMVGSNHNRTCDRFKFRNEIVFA